MKRHKPNRSRRPAREFVARDIELNLTATSHDGRGIGRVDGKTVFVSGALEGERVRARLTSDQSRYSEARCLEVLQPAAERVEPRCRHFGHCGGCQLQFMDARHQPLVKQQGLLNQLARAGVPAPEQIAQPLVAQSYGYRTRARLGVTFDKAGQVSLGFRQWRDKQLVNLRQCPVLANELEALLDPLNKWLQQFQLYAVTHIDLIATQARPACVLRHTQAIPDNALAALRELAQEHQLQLWLQAQKDPSLLIDLDGQSVDPRLSLPLPEYGLELGFHPADFTQVNTHINQLMLRQAMTWLNAEPGTKVLDLFCGMGNFTLPMASLGVEVTGIEAVETMVQRGRENAERNGLSQAQFRACDLTRTSLSDLLTELGTADALLLDPPRAGAQQVCEQLPDSAIKRVLYVSCNPATLARDAQTLTQGGYRLARLGVMDMFPQTAHVESMALFER
ncbi:23S rRNA (uracil(1939)-C(5))-methyltransferase RlmD [Gilvimarinus sp. DA14]|uniref:23S rRNA (uracil(1939)-C(5))-methyltransferase RlmD n=1 Tax=Gilvimarinus sp. DA14 TaxID=2956798 RepID=UPI0020B788E4|nr:23S rRNA (uracil(1939)-C(5))-methyltransferase RlmD [Gilvimarinus sp. DA14]UTF61039.1 23S rRNA (uracil(1939)-C(5))-methyltransferase RlmD [Gilvimarinus sp. DA14]